MLAVVRVGCSKQSRRPKAATRVRAEGDGWVRNRPVRGSSPSRLGRHIQACLLAGPSLALASAALRVGVQGTGTGSRAWCRESLGLAIKHRSVCRFGCKRRPRADRLPSRRRDVQRSTGKPQLRVCWAGWASGHWPLAALERCVCPGPDVRRADWCWCWWTKYLDYLGKRAGPLRPGLRRSIHFIASISETVPLPPTCQPTSFKSSDA